MSYTNYENNFIAAETERFTAPASTCTIEETAVLLVTKSLAEANAEEILDIVLNNALNYVCPQSPGRFQLCDKYDVPATKTQSVTNILSVLEMESNLPVRQTAKTNLLSDYSYESGDESQEEPVFTSPIYVKSGPENINILEENGIAESCKMSKCKPQFKHQPLDSESSASLGIYENVAQSEGLASGGNDQQILSTNLDSRMIANCQSKSQISEKEDIEYSENIGDANDTTRTIDKIEPKSSSSEQKVSLVGKIIGDVVPDFNGSDDVGLQLQPQVVQAYVIYPGNSANAENTITTNSENTATTEMEGDAFGINNLNKDEGTTSSSNEASEETSLVVNEVGNLLNYFEQVNNTVDVRVRIVDNSSNEGIRNCGTICEEVKRAVKEIAAAVFEGQGDGTSTELSNLSIQLANHQEQSTPEIEVRSPDQPPVTDQFCSTQIDREQAPIASTSKSDGEEQIPVHKTLSVDSNLEDFLSDMYLQDEMDEREVQVILRDDDGETESLNGAAFDSEYPQLANYLPSGMNSQEDLEDNFTYRSVSDLNLTLKKSFLDTSKITKVVDGLYSLQHMAREMEKRNPNIKANLTLGKVGGSRQSLGKIKVDGEIWEIVRDPQPLKGSTKEKSTLEENPTFKEKPTLEENPTFKEKPTIEEKPAQEDELTLEEKSPVEENKPQRRRWHQLRNLLSCFKNKRQSSDDL